MASQARGLPPASVQEGPRSSLDLFAVNTLDELVESVKLHNERTGLTIKALGLGVRLLALKEPFQVHGTVHSLTAASGEEFFAALRAKTMITEVIGCGIRVIWRGRHDFQLAGGPVETKRKEGRSERKK